MYPARVSRVCKRLFENSFSSHLPSLRWLPLPEGEEARLEEAFFLLLPLGEGWDEGNKPGMENFKTVSLGLHCQTAINCKCLPSNVRGIIRC